MILLVPCDKECLPFHEGKDSQLATVVFFSSNRRFEEFLHSRCILILTENCLQICYRVQPKTENMHISQSDFFRNAFILF